MITSPRINGSQEILHVIVSDTLVNAIVTVDEYDIGDDLEAAVVAVNWNGGQCETFSTQWDRADPWPRHHIYDVVRWIVTTNTVKATK